MNSTGEPTPPTPLFPKDDGNVFNSDFEGKGGTAEDAQREFASKTHALDFALFHFEDRDSESVEAQQDLHQAHEDLADARGAMQEFNLLPFNKEEGE